VVLAAVDIDRPSDVGPCKVFSPSLSIWAGLNSN
jgi:hypothetical protein